MKGINPDLVKEGALIALVAAVAGPALLGIRDKGDCPAVIAGWAEILRIAGYEVTPDDLATFLELLVPELKTLPLRPPPS